MRATTVAEFRQQVLDTQTHHPDWRPGQVVFNVAVNSPDEALASWTNHIRATPLDPYHDSSRVDAFIEAAVRAGHLTE